MSKNGTAITWKGAFGFAEMADGRLVYIHTDEIDGGRLRVGHKVKFDMEEVEGHDGKVKGTNVSGPAVLAKDTKLSDAEMEADRAVRAEMREKNIAKNKVEFDPVWAAVEGMNRANKMHMVRELVKELGMSDRVTFESDKRVDPTQRGSQKFTRGEFIAFYGKQQGDRMWNQAGKKGGKKPARN